MEVDPIHGENVIRPDGAIAPVADWDTIADWWRGEAADDPVYREDVAPMLSRLMEPATAPILDLGCGDGQWLRWLERDVGRVIGCDRSGALLADAGATHPVALCELPSLAWLQGQTLGTAFSVFVFDLVENIDALFAEVGRVVVPGGSHVVIINLPAFTARDPARSWTRTSTYSGDGANTSSAEPASCQRDLERWKCITGRPATS